MSAKETKNFVDDEIDFEKEQKSALDYDVIEPEVQPAAEAGKKKGNSNLLKIVAPLVLLLVVMVVALWYLFASGESQAPQTAKVTMTKPAPSPEMDRSIETLQKAMAANVGNANTGMPPPAPNANLPANYPPDAVYNPYENPRPPAPVNPDANPGGKNQPGDSSAPKRSNQSSPNIVESERSPQEIKTLENSPNNAGYRAALPSRNTQRSLYFYEQVNSSDSSSNAALRPLEFVRAGETRKIAPEVPEIPFGTMLPVRTLGAIHTLNSDNLVRLELTQAVEIENFILPRGTVFIGRNSGGVNNRVFISLIGWLDNNRIVSLGGDLVNIDGAPGLIGDVKTMQSRMSRVFSKGFDVFSKLGIEYLRNRTQRQGTNTTNIYGSANPEELLNTARGTGGDVKKFVFVKSGTEGYIFVNALPPALRRSANTATTSNPANSSGSGQLDADLLKILESGSQEELENYLRQIKTGQ